MSIDKSLESGDRPVDGAEHSPEMLLRSESSAKHAQLAQAACENNRDGLWDTVNSGRHRHLSQSSDSPQQLRAAVLAYLAGRDMRS